MHHEDVDTPGDMTEFCDNTVKETFLSILPVLLLVFWLTSVLCSGVLETGGCLVSLTGTGGYIVNIPEIRGEYKCEYKTGISLNKKTIYNSILEKNILFF